MDPRRETITGTKPGEWVAPGYRGRTGEVEARAMEERQGTTTELEARPDAGAIWLSILVPVYNVAPFLRCCLESISAQLPVQGVEIVLLDDASTDGSLAICEEYVAERGTTARLLRHDVNRGLSAARNTMLDHARGAYIWFVDSDDEIMPGTIERVRGVVDRAAPDLILGDYEKQGKAVASFVGQANSLSVDREALLRGVFASRRMHSWSKIARRAVWSDDLRFPEGRCFEDQTTTPRLALRARSFFYLPEPLIRYRVRSDSITGIMSRSRGRFDRGKNDDVALAMAGVVDTARRDMPTLGDDTLYAIGQFMAKEFTKICWRLLSTRLGRDCGRTIADTLRRYRMLMEQSAPKPFAELNRDHLRRRKPGRWIVLGLCLLLTRRKRTWPIDG